MVVVAGSNDQHVFDNARKTAVAQFQGQVREVKQITTNAKLVDQFTRYASIKALKKALRDNAGKCFLYLTSHGSRQGFALGSDTLTPNELDEILTEACPGPTVVIVSACFSGTFAYGAMQKPNRIVLTAAAPDRTSFGCSNDLQYTFWDGCFLRNVAAAKTWEEAYNLTGQCVIALEHKLGAIPSGPLMYIGEQVTVDLFR